MNREPKIIFRNGSAIECLPAGETVRGHRSEFPFIEWDLLRLPSDYIINEVLKSFEIKSKRRIALESKVFDLIAAEQKRQNENIELIASENFVSENVMRAVGSCLTNKYAEGYPAVRDTGNKGRYYGGCECVDAVETYCRSGGKCFKRTTTSMYSPIPEAALIWRHICLY